MPTKRSPQSVDRVLAELLFGTVERTEAGQNARVASLLMIASARHYMPVKRGPSPMALARKLVSGFVW